MKRCHNFHISSCCRPVLLFLNIFIILPPKDFSIIIFSLTGHCQTGFIKQYIGILWFSVIDYKIGLEMSKHTLLCLYYRTVCFKNNWQKNNWKLGFQSDVTVFKENFVFNMQYHVKLLVLGVKSTVEVECHVTTLFKRNHVIRTCQKPDTVCCVPHIMHILSLCCLFKIVLVKMYKISWVL